MTTRLLVTMLALTAVLLGVLVVPLGLESARSERRDLEAKVERDAAAVASLAEDALEAGVRPAGLDRLAERYERETGGRIVVVDAEGRSLVDPDTAVGRDFSTRPEVATALTGEISVGTRRSQTLGAGLLYVAVPVASGGTVRGAVRITYPTTTADERVRNTWLALGAISVLALAIASGLAVWLARWASRPLVRLEAAAEGVAAGNLAARAPVEGPPEVRAVASSFNAMVGRVESMLEDQSAFVADASHQLRTPLTALRLRLENLAADQGADSDALQAATAEIDRLAELVDGLLALARSEAGVQRAETVDLSALASERVAAWEALAVERGASISYRGRGGVAASAGRDRVEQTVDNLLSNALEAVGRGGAIVVDVEARPDAAELAVRDDGPGLTDDDKRRAFDRFWRGRETSGSGLGLAIVRRLVELDGGTVSLTDAAGGGLVVVVRYPRRAGVELDPSAGTL
ncbi:MAG: ATP-binding protein [Gaiella sp.]